MGRSRVKIVDSRIEDIGDGVLRGLQTREMKRMSDERCLVFVHAYYSWNLKKMTWSGGSHHVQ